MSEYDPNFIFEPVYFLAGVKTILINSDNKVLLLKRSSKTANPHQWDFPGGGVDRGENPEMSAIREVKEETGLEAVELKPIITCLVADRSEEAIIIGFSARTSNSDVVLSWEHEDHKWIAIDDVGSIGLPELHAKIFKAFVSK
ncbi:MAG: NUDIX hydrolase [Candidatus Saccharimonas sp.]